MIHRFFRLSRALRSQCARDWKEHRSSYLAVALCLTCFLPAMCPDEMAKRPQSKSALLTASPCISTICRHHLAEFRCLPGTCAIPLADQERYQRSKVLFSPRAAAVAAAAPISSTFQLHSRSSATKIIYLDFDGHITTGTRWNTDPNPDVTRITTASLTIDEAPEFSDSEFALIQEIWQRVSEHYSPFDVDVTTQAPTSDQLMNSGGSDTKWGIRVVFGKSTPDPAPGAGGVAYLNSFNYATDTPCFVYSTSRYHDAKVLADAAVHETGHTLGLSHDGRDLSGQSEAYYLGHGTDATGWAPQMGVGYYKKLVQWSQGEYAGANNHEDDLKIITNLKTNGFGFRADDFGNTKDASTALAGTLVSSTFNVAQNGVIETPADSDWFRLTTIKGSVNLSATGGPVTTMLDINLELYNSQGLLVVASNSASDLSASINSSIEAGTYYLKIEGTGNGDPLDKGYTDYGSLGQYQITGSYPYGTPPVASKITASYVKAKRTLTLVGDGGHNTVTVTYKNSKITVAGSASTQVNNSASFSVSHVGSLVLTVDLNAGDDSLSLIGLDSSATNIRMGPGNDSVVLTLSRFTTFTLDGGADTDTLVMTSSTLPAEGNAKRNITGIP